MFNVSQKFSINLRSNLKCSNNSRNHCLLNTLRAWHHSGTQDRNSPINWDIDSNKLIIQIYWFWYQYNQDIIIIPSLQHEWSCKRLILWMDVRDRASSYHDALLKCENKACFQTWRIYRHHSMFQEITFRIGGDVIL